MREMGTNHSSIMVLRIWPKFWYLLPMGVTDNHTKYEPKTQRWRPGTGVPSAGPACLQFRAKISLFFCPKPFRNGQMKGNSGYSTHAARLPCAERLSRAPLTTQYVRERAHKAQNLCTLAADSHKPKTDHILGCVAHNAIPSAPNPPATTHFWWFPPLKIALTDA